MAQPKLSAGPKGNLSFQVKNGETCRRSCDDCVLTDYNRRLVEKFYNTLNVSAVLNCETGNAPYLFVQDGVVTGFTADLLREVASRIPGIETINIVAKSSLPEALDDVTIGTSVLDITLTPITRELLLDRPTVGYLTVALAAPTLGGANQQYLVYLPAGAPLPDNPCDFANVVSAVGATGLPESLANSTCITAGTSKIYVREDNVVGLAVLGTLPTTPILVDAPLATAADVFARLAGDRTRAVLLPGLSVDQIALLHTFDFIVTPFLVTGVFAPPPASLGFGWAYLKSAVHFGLWLQRAFDEFVATGGYLDLLEFWGLTAATLPPSSLLQALAVPPRYYSLTTGTIPQVSVIETFLPKLACVAPSNDIELNIICPITPTIAPPPTAAPAAPVPST